MVLLFRDILVGGNRRILKPRLTDHLEETKSI